MNLRHTCRLIAPFSYPLYERPCKWAAHRAGRSWKSVARAVNAAEPVCVLSQTSKLDEPIFAQSGPSHYTRATNKAVKLDSNCSQVFCITSHIYERYLFTLCWRAPEKTLCNRVIQISWWKFDKLEALRNNLLCFRLLFYLSFSFIKSFLPTENLHNLVYYDVTLWEFSTYINSLQEGRIVRKSRGVHFSSKLIFHASFIDLNDGFHKFSGAFHPKGHKYLCNCYFCIFITGFL